MADILFSPSTQPTYDCIFANLNILRADVITKRLINGAVIEADELFTNANPLIIYVSNMLYFYNNEGGNRNIYINDATGNVIYASAVIANLSTLTLSYITVFSFTKLDASAALVAAGTTLSFTGYRINLIP